jgi:drug/metabolite transporter (DMT)-like permease
MNFEYVLMSLLIGFLWGVSPIMQKHFLKKFDKFSLMFFFSVIYFLILLIVSVSYKKSIFRDFYAMTNHDFFLIFIYVFFTIFLTNYLLLHVLKTHDSYIVSAIVEGTAPFFTLLLVYLFIHENITTVGVLGVLLIISGILCIASNDASFKMEEFLGIR